MPDRVTGRGPVIAPEMCVRGRDLSEPRLTRDASSVVYAVSEDGSAWLVVHALDESQPDRKLATKPGLRPARGLGGGSWCFVGDETAVAYLGCDGDLWVQAIKGGVARQLTSFGAERKVSSPCPAPDGRSLVFAVDESEIHHLDIEANVVRRIDDGSADFCFDPFVDANGRSVRWQAWNVPDMPWDHSRLQVGTVGDVGDGTVLNEAGSGCLQQARSLPDGTPICVRDDEGWLNVWVGGQPLISEPFEHAGPTWGPGQRSYAWSPDGETFAIARNERGFGRLCVVPTSGGPIREVARAVHGQLSWAGDRLACIRSGARTRPSVVVYNTETWQRTVVAVGGSPAWETIELVEPEAVEVAVADGVAEGIIHARHYRGRDRGRDRGLIVWLHGGPTDQWQVTFMPRLAYWAAQGWNILVPDHRGSTGHGRAYQQALRGQWGVLDVSDTIAVTKHAHALGWGRPGNTLVMGGSSGGFTALESVAAESSLFAAAVVLYPVTDLLDLAERSHRFERHYTDSLIGPLPKAAGEYLARSPITHCEQLVANPLLILHGEEDPVVPVEQSITLADRVRTAGGVVELQVYEGEGHGFRKQGNQLDEYQRISEFLARHVPLASAP